VRSVEESWQEDLYQAVRAARVTLVAYVPDAGHAHLIRRAVADPGVRAVPLTTEEEGVGLLAGADLGGTRGVLLMQSSGVGNCVNQLSLVKAGRFPFVTLVSMRGEFGEGNPWQFPMGEATPAVLEAMGVRCLWVRHAEEVAPTAVAAFQMAYTGGRAVAVLLSQQLIGAKHFPEPGG
jgi:sulfopyruvate decarboxylase alpha subunit